MDDLISKVIPTEATRKLVRAMIPVLIYWAKTGQTNHTYGDLAAAIGRPEYHRLGKPLARLQNVMDALAVSSKREIPTLNSLVRNKSKGIPSDGFSYVSKKYTQFNPTEKKIFVDGLNSQACAYEHWDLVLSQFGLSPYTPFTQAEIDSIKVPSAKYGGGEGAEHKALKEYIHNNPDVLGLKNVIFREMEHPLPSGDKLDVYFELADGTHVAVEVKPSTSDDSDITRGIFQCVKYKAVMEALQSIEAKNYTTAVLYVTARELLPLHTRLIDKLSIVHNALNLDKC